MTDTNIYTIFFFLKEIRVDKIIYNPQNEIAIHEGL